MAKATVSVTGTDRAIRSAAEIIKRLKGRNQVLVGVQKGSGTYEDGTPIAVIAAANHFGANLREGVTIPARPFLDAAIAKNKARYSKIFKHLIPSVIDGKMTTEQMLNSVGEAASSDVQEFMVELRDPPNAASTIAKKGSDNPLVDTGSLRQSIRHEIARDIVTEGV